MSIPDSPEYSLEDQYRDHLYGVSLRVLMTSGTIYPIPKGLDIQLAENIFNEVIKDKQQMKKEPIDVVNSPPHYKLFPDLEAVQAIEKILTPKEYRGYLKGCILKYRLRAGKKGPAEKTIEDIHKSMKYEEFLFTAEAKRQDPQEIQDND